MISIKENKFIHLNNTGTVSYTCSLDCDSYEINDLIEELQEIKKAYAEIENIGAVIIEIHSEVYSDEDYSFWLGASATRAATEEEVSEYLQAQSAKKEEADKAYINQQIKFIRSKVTTKAELLDVADALVSGKPYREQEGA